MVRRYFGFISRGWFKAGLIALPATIYFGPMAIAGVIVAIIDSPRGKTLTNIDLIFLLLGLGGIFGLVGAWLKFVFQTRLSQRMSIFNWVVCFLLLSGVGASFWVLFINGVEFFLKYSLSSLQHSFFSLSLLVVGLYGAYLAITVVIPNRGNEQTR